MEATATLRRSRSKVMPVLLPPALIAILAIIVFKPWFMPRTPAAAFSGHAVTASAVVTARAQGRITATVDSINGRPCNPYKANFNIADYCDPPLREMPSPGYRATVRAVFEPLDGPAPAAEAFDYKAMLRNSGVAATATISSDSALLALTPAAGFKAALRRMQGRLASTIIDMDGLSPGAATFLAATLTGDSYDLPPSERQLFAAGGIAHVLSLSGLHLLIMVGIFSLALLPLKLMGLHKTRLITLILLAWGYTMLTGMPVSLVRASVMITAMMLAKIMSVRYSSLNAICLAALLILAFDPLQLFSTGFQLSFAAATGIMMIDSIIPWPQWRKHPLVAIAAVSTAATVSTAVLSLWYFHGVAPAFLPANFAGMILTGPLLGMGVICLLFTALGIPATIPAAIANGLLSLLESSARAAASVGGDWAWNIWLNPVAAIILGAATVALFWAGVTRRRGPVMIALGLLASGIVAASIPTGIRDMSPVFTTDNPQVVMLVPDPPVMWVMPAHDRLPAKFLEEDTETRYAAFMARRRLREARIMPADLSCPDFARKGAMAVIDNATWLFVNDFNANDSLSVSLPAGKHVDIIAAGFGFNHDIVKLVEEIAPDSVALLHTLNKRLAKRYASELQLSAIKISSIR